MDNVIESIQPKPRVVLLYRASSKKQTDSENDIPLQRNILKPWAEQKGWDFICEKVEGGISGYKISASKRDAIIEIKAMAERREFDILGIYMSDRLGRIAEETPLIVSFLNSRGIRVVSYCEGEINSSTHSDKLMTYIRYWQAEGESLKTSMRCTDAIEQCVKNGKWRGGNPPYGYRTVSRGTLNYKGKPVFDVEIVPDEAAIIKEIYNLYLEENCGVKTIGHILNNRGIIGQDGKGFRGSQVRNILRNKMYCGVYVLGKKSNGKKCIESPVMDDLKIIDQSTWQKAQNILDSKKPNVQHRPTRRGALLLTGLVYCGCCKKKMTSHYQNIGHDFSIPISERKYSTRYRCRNYEVVSKEHRCKPSIYQAKVIDALVVSDAKVFISSLDKEKIINNYRTKVEAQIDELAAQLERKILEVRKIESETAKIKEKLLQVVLGNSNISESFLAETLKEKDSALFEAKNELSEIQSTVFQLESDLHQNNVVHAELSNWSERFDNLDEGHRKSMLINLLNRIEVYGDRIEVEYKVRLDSCLGDERIIPVDFKSVESAGFFALSGAKRVCRDLTMCRIMAVL